MNKDRSITPSALRGEMREGWVDGTLACLWSELGSEEEGTIPAIALHAGLEEARKRLRPAAIERIGDLLSHYGQPA